MKFVEGITYNQLITELQKWTPDELNQEVRIFTWSDHGWSKVTRVCYDEDENEISLESE